MSMHGWMGKIIHVDLSNSKIAQWSTQRYATEYLGGRGIASKIYWETVAPEVGAFDPGNKLIFMTGSLVATGAQGATRLAIAGKSPMAFPEGYCYANIGGFFGAELKRAGYDGIVIEGHAPKPTYLWIHNGIVELRDASSLWGHGAYRTGELLQHAHGKKVRFITTGVAGERKVRTAVILGSHESTASAGFGAVMGSKNLKALAVVGTRMPSVADPDQLKELNRYTIHICERYSRIVPPSVEGTDYASLFEVIGKGHCHQCGLDCLKRKYRYGKSLEGYRRCQSMEYYLPWHYSRTNEPIQTLFDAPTLANDYSIETFELRHMVRWLYACYRAGALTEQETGLPLSKIGTREFLEHLLHSIAYRDRFGDVLAEGLIRAKEKVSEKARSLFSSAIAAIGHHDVFPPRAFVAQGLLYAMEPRVCPPIHHEISRVWHAWRANQRQPNLCPVTTKVVHDIAKAFWGSDEAGDMSSYEGKALSAKKIQNRTYIKDSLGLCDAAWPITYSFNTPNHVGDPDLEAKFSSAVTGVAEDEIDRYADRIFHLQRLILLREGWKVPEADLPLEFNFTEPLGADELGRIMRVPGPGDKVIDATGKKLDRVKFESMLKEYYRLRGWDEATGLPHADTLVSLGLDNIAPNF